MQQEQYDCHAFSDELAKGRASGQMRVGPEAIVFDVQSHHHSLSINELEVSHGGASNRLIFFSHPRVPGWRFYTSDRSVLKNPNLAKNPQIAASFSQARTRRRLGWAWLLAVVFVIVGVPAFLLFRMDIVSAVVADRVPVSWEEKLGDSSVAQYRLGKEMMPQEEAEQLLAPLVEPLIKALPQSPYEYNFSIVHDSTLNAFALPGGEVVIHSGLIGSADNAEQLLGVLAHEITHVEEKHGIRNVIGSAGIYLLISGILGDVNGVLAVLANATPLLLNQSYSRRFEREADARGFELLVAANIHPQGMVSFFEKLKQKEQDMLDSIDDENTREVVNEAMVFLSTHPATQERIENLSAMVNTVDQSRNFRDFSQAFETLQQAVNDFTANAKEDNNNEN